MIDRYHLRYFLAIVDAGNFSKAARLVNVTQPTLSIGLAKLEASLGARLFLRSSRRVQLTEAGVRLLVHARAIETEFNSLEDRVSSAKPQRALRLGVLSTIPTRFVAKIVCASRTHDQSLVLELVEGGERDLVERLQRRRIDLALTIIRSGEARFSSKVLYSEGYSLVAADWHAVARAGEIRGELLATETMIVRRHCEVLPETSRYFTDRGVRPRFSFRSTNDDRTMALVKAGLGITVAPDSFAEPGLALVKLVGFDQTRQIGLLFATSEWAADERLSIFDGLG